MESIRLVWALERGQALGLDENQVAGHSITRVNGWDLRVAICEKFPLAQNGVDHR